VLFAFAYLLLRHLFNFVAGSSISPMWSFA
jgi:hypothetical protein